MKKFRVKWTETYLCSSEVYEETGEGAIDAVLHAELNGSHCQRHREFGGYEHWECEEMKED